ncbi:MAG: hypothetical protein ACOC2F_07295, partial [Bacteroidota bacterium]
GTSFIETNSNWTSLSKITKNRGAQIGNISSTGYTIKIGHYIVHPANINSSLYFRVILFA